MRVTHLPTGIVVAVQNERSQLANKTIALKILAARLAERARKEREAQLAALRGDRGDIAFGSQIRSYVLHPYQMVKDHRTGVETGNVQAVLDGDLDQFVAAELRRRATDTPVARVRRPAVAVGLLVATYVAVFGTLTLGPARQLRDLRLRHGPVRPGHLAAVPVPGAVRDHPRAQLLRAPREPDHGAVRARLLARGRPSSCTWSRRSGWRSARCRCSCWPATGCRAAGWAWPWPAASCCTRRWSGSTGGTSTPTPWSSRRCCSPGGWPPAAAGAGSRSRSRSLACKEDAALAVIMLGLVLAVLGERRAGLLTAAAGAGWFLLATRVVIPAAGGGDGPFYQELFPGFGDSLGEIVWTMVVHPSRLLDLATLPDRLSYYWHVLGPGGLLSPGRPAGPAHLAAADGDQRDLGPRPDPRLPFHYTAIVLAGVFLATVEAMALAGRGRRPAGAGGVLVAVALVANVAWSPSPLGRQFDDGWRAGRAPPRHRAGRPAGRSRRRRGLGLLQPDPAPDPPDLRL